MRCQYCNKKLGFFHLRKTPFCSEEHEERYRAEMSGSGVSRLKEMFGPALEAEPRPVRPLGTPAPIQAEAPKEPAALPAQAAPRAPEPAPTAAVPLLEAAPEQTRPAPIAPTPVAQPPVAQPAPPPAAGFLVVKSRPLFGPRTFAGVGSTAPLNPDVSTVLPPSSGNVVRTSRTGPGQPGKAPIAPPPVQLKPASKPAGAPQPAPPRVAGPELPRSGTVISPQRPAPEQRPKAYLEPTPAQTWPRLKPDGAAEITPSATLKPPTLPHAANLSAPQKAAPEQPAKAHIPLSPRQAKPADLAPQLQELPLTPEVVSPALPRTEPAAENRAQLPRAADSEKLATEEAIMSALFPHPAIGQRPSPAAPPTVLDPFREDFAARRLATIFPVRATTTIIRLNSGEPGPNEPKAYYAPPAAGRVSPRWEAVEVAGNLFSDAPECRVLPESPLREPALRHVSKALAIARAEIGVEWTAHPSQGVFEATETSRTPAAHALRMRSPIPESLPATGLGQWSNFPGQWFGAPSSTAVRTVEAIESTAEAVASALRLRSPLPEYLAAAGLAQTPNLPRGLFGNAAAPSRTYAFADFDEMPVVAPEVHYPIADSAPENGIAILGTFTTPPSPASPKPARWQNLEEEVPASVPDVHAPMAETAPENGIAILGAFTTPPSPASPGPIRWQVLDPEEASEDPILPGIVELSRLTTTWARLASPKTPDVRTLAQKGSSVPAPAELDPKILDGETLGSSEETCARKLDVHYPVAESAQENGLGISGTYETAPLPTLPEPSGLEIHGLAYTWRSPLLPGVAHPSVHPRSASTRALSYARHDSPIPPLVQNRVVPAVVEVLGPEMPQTERRALVFGPWSPASWTVQNHFVSLRTLPDPIEAQVPAFALQVAESDPLELTVSACFTVPFFPFGPTLFIADRPHYEAFPQRRRALANVVCALPPSEPTTHPLPEAGSQARWEPAAPQDVKRVSKTFVRLRPALRPPAIPARAS